MKRAFGGTLSVLVVVAGAGVAAVVFYSTGTELFSSNSPTRMYEDAIERIKRDAQVSQFLIEPFSFHSSNGVHRSRRVTSSFDTEPDGTKVMRLHFFVNAVDPQKSQLSWFDKARQAIGVAIWEDTNKPGSFVSSHEKQLEQERVEKEQRERQQREQSSKGWTSWLSSAFGTLLNATLGLGSNQSASTVTSAVSRRKRPPKGTYSSGEVVAELVQDPATQHFVYRHLVVDIPHSRDPAKWQIQIDTSNHNNSTLIDSTETIAQQQPQKAPDRYRFITRSRTA